MTDLKNTEIINAIQACGITDKLISGQCMRLFYTNEIGHYFDYVQKVSN